MKIISCCLLLAVGAQARVGGSPDEELHRKLEDLKVKIESLEARIPSLESKIDTLQASASENTIAASILHNRNLQNSCGFVVDTNGICALNNELLVVHGDVSVVGNTVKVGGLVTSGDLVIKGNALFNDTFIHTGDLTSVSGGFTVGGATTVNDDMAVIGSLETEDAKFWGNVDVKGPDSTTTFMKDLDVKGDAIVQGNGNMYGDIIVDSFNAKRDEWHVTIKSDWIDIKDKSYWQSTVSVKDGNKLGDMRVDDLIITGFCFGSNCP